MELLKIAVSHDCTFLKEQLIINRGAMLHKQVYMDYGLLGYHHNILRIIRHDTVTWTTCSFNSSFCPDLPLQLIDHSYADVPCCYERLNLCLIDVVKAFNQVGIDYRVCYGTLHGAVRSKNIIPWTEDIDI